MRLPFENGYRNPSGPTGRQSSARVTLALGRLDSAVVDARADRPPVLSLCAGPTELRVVVPADEVTATHVAAVRQLAEVTARFAADIEKRYSGRPR